ncbi:E3 ubiquitin-protein ligase ccnb1ip1-like protein [Thalictrum thalictroides]|uniref:E3 ubiquitin-protein ligase ccnb1ip1-like protein n=1 Tax=Thalictrum thalictroides TaxID=46969 RepID=A0A7J6VCU0_THATH|nr:E3 ubiquitin-protein ligase ccnb1ip1-like protein [Thalictrum thalictroides]
MYDQLRSEYDSVKRSTIQPAGNFFSIAVPDLFASPANIMDNRDSLRQDHSIFLPDTPGRRQDIWPAARQKANSGPFNISGGSPAKQVQILGDVANRRPGARSLSGAGVGNPSMTLRNLITSPMKQPQLSRNRTQMFS